MTIEKKVKLFRSFLENTCKMNIGLVNINYFQFKIVYLMVICLLADEFVFSGVERLVGGQCTRGSLFLVWVHNTRIDFACGENKGLPESL